MPTPSTYDHADGHVIHLVPKLEAPSLAQAPQALGFPRRMGRSGRAWFALLNLIASIGAIWGSYQLWTDETPGWWFNLIFTVMLGGLALALWAILYGSIQQAKLEARLQAVWRAIGPRAVASGGRVTERRWKLAEEGAVTAFSLVVQISDERPVRGEWHPVDSRAYLLQTQVPGVGAEVRVWRAANAAADAPLVIEVADPSVVG